MRVKSAFIRDFRRFQEVSIRHIPAEALLVVLTGPNGCGKSALFDAFATWYGYHRDWGDFDATYHARSGSGASSWKNCIQLEFHEPVPSDPNERKKLFYIRSAYRNEAEFTVNSFQKYQSTLDDSRRVKKLIDNDVHVSDNYQRLVAQTIAAVYDPQFDGTTVRELRDLLVGQVRESMLRVFDALVLSSIGDPLQAGSFFFDKGASKEFHYKNLSGGEKAAFDLILDLVVKRLDYDNTVFCIDEPEQHMSTRLQGCLLGELYNLLPKTCQLWISTHSIGMMREAKRLHQAGAGVVFLDFDNRDFDNPVTIEPTVPTRSFWMNALKVALDDLADLVAPAQVVLCEGKLQGQAKRSKAEFDAACYRKIFEREFPDTDFISVGNSDEVQNDHLGAGRAIQTIVSGTKILRVIDRDDRSDTEIRELETEGVKVLSRRHLEAYLLDEEILTILCSQKGQSEKAPLVLQAKQDALQASQSRGNPSDDIKSAAGQIYNSIKSHLNLTSAGSNKDAFCRDTLAPLVTPETTTYRLLKADIFGP